MHWEWRAPCARVDSTLRDASKFPCQEHGRVLLLISVFCGFLRYSPFALMTCLIEKIAENRLQYGNDASGVVGARVSPLSRQ